MDSVTHVELAIKLLSLAKEETTNALTIASLFPQIDRNPPTLHRLYAHSAFKAEKITDLGLRFFFNGNFSEIEKSSFDHRRFLEDRPRFESYLEKVAPQTSYQYSNSDLAVGMMGFISHLYLDTYNQPTQAFMPYSIQCCGQWKLWEKIGDFRLQLYTTDAINELREELFADKLWNDSKSFTSAVIIEAMLIQTCKSSQDAIALTVVDKVMKHLAINNDDRKEVAKACNFFTEFEALLFKLHLKVLGNESSIKTA